MEILEEQISEEEKKYKALVGEKEKGKPHQEITAQKRQLVEKATPEKEMDQPTSESRYESTGSVITVINTNRSYAEAARRKGNEKE